MNKPFRTLTNDELELVAGGRSGRFDARLTSTAPSYDPAALAALPTVAS